MKRILLFCLVCCYVSAAISQQWPTPLPEAKAGTRWWWLGSAVDKPNLEWNLSEYARVGIGAVGTGVYTTTFQMTKQQAREHWMINLGDVRESARVYINGQFIGCAWAVPFILDCRNTLKKGKNELRVEVTNLPANRISGMDRRTIPWRKMKEINVVDINYKKTTYESWQPVKSGLNGVVRLFTK